MGILFRQLSSPDALVAQPGEFYLVPAAADQRGCLEIAKFVFDNGPKALLHGPGRMESLVIRADPTLDDMLAASFLLRLAEGKINSPGCRQFAVYTAHLREGNWPTTFPPENSLEGVFLAMRAKFDKPLTDVATGEQFLADWRRLEKVIVLMAEKDLAPFNVPLFELNSAGERIFSVRSANQSNLGIDEGDFDGELLFLAKDLETYQQDVAQGERWSVRLPGDSGKAKGLLLRQPKSLLWGYWTRSLCPRPARGPFRFLAVAWGDGKWVFSTSSTQRLSLKPLAEILQKMEQKQASKEGNKDRWNAGQAPHVTVTSPNGGSQLTELAVLGAVTKWCRAWPPARRRKYWRAASLVGCVTALMALGLFFWKPWQTKRPRIDIHDIYVLSVGVSNYKNEDMNLTTPANDSRAIVATLADKLKDKICKKVITNVLTNEEATRGGILNFGLKDWLLRQQKGVTNNSLVIITFSGHGDIEKESDAYYFCPYDFVEGQATSGIFLSDLQRYTDTLPCPVIFIFDTCHSGAAKREVPTQAGSPLFRQIRNSLKKNPANKGLVVMAACASHQKAMGNKRWGYGALTLALLEGIKGEYHYEPKGNESLPVIPLPKPESDGIVALSELDRYVTDRVQALSTENSQKYFDENRLQAARAYVSGELSLDQIPISFKSR